MVDRSNLLIYAATANRACGLFANSKPVLKLLTVRRNGDGVASTRRYGYRLAATDDVDHQVSATSGQSDLPPLLPLHQLQLQA